MSQLVCLLKVVVIINFKLSLPGAYQSVIAYVMGRATSVKINRWIDECTINLLPQ